MAKGSARRRFTLDLSRSDPDSVMPGGFHDGQPHYDRPPYVVSLGVGGAVLIYDSLGNQIEDTTWGWTDDANPNVYTEVAAPTELWVEPVAAGSGDLELTLSYSTVNECEGWAPDTGGPNTNIATDYVKITVVEVNLSATDLYGQVAPEHKVNPGAFVHYNVDNDNNGDNALGAPKHPGGDYLKTGPVAGENNLKLLTMSLSPALQQGLVVLARSNGNARVWKSATKGQGNEILVGDSTKTWDLSNAQQRDDFNAVKNSLYVEGYGGGTCMLGLFYKLATGETVATDYVYYTFIAADCGDQPRTEAVPTWRWNYTVGQWEAYDPPGRYQRAEILTQMPALVGCEWSVTAQLTYHDDHYEALKDYNCMAWSVDQTNHRYTEAEILTKYGSIDNFYWEEKRWTPIGGNISEDQKAAQAEAIYYSGFHAARRKAGCPCGAGKWIMFESKVGAWERIEHRWDQVMGGWYNRPVTFYK